MDLENKPTPCSPPNGDSCVLQSWAQLRPGAWWLLHHSGLATPGHDGGSGKSNLSVGATRYTWDRNQELLLLQGPGQRGQSHDL